MFKIHGFCEVHVTWESYHSVVFFYYIYEQLLFKLPRAARGIPFSRIFYFAVWLRFAHIIPQCLLIVLRATSHSSESFRSSSPPCTLSPTTPSLLLPTRLLRNSPKIPLAR